MFPCAGITTLHLQHFWVCYRPRPPTLNTPARVASSNLMESVKDGGLELAKKTSTFKGRRWAGRMRNQYNTKRGEQYKCSIYDASTSFESYGIAHGDRAGPIAAVPEKYKEFLRNLVWIHEQEGDETEDPETSYKELIASACGSKSKLVDDQMQMLKTKDPKLPRIGPVAGRRNVWDTPPKVLVVSGRHGKLHFESNRLIIDESGGFDDRLIAAMILPARELVRDTGGLLETVCYGVSGSVACDRR